MLVIKYWKNLKWYVIKTPWQSPPLSLFPVLNFFSFSETCVEATFIYFFSSRSSDYWYLSGFEKNITKSNAQWIKKFNADFDFKNRGFFILKKWLDHLWKKVVINWKERISNEKERIGNEKGISKEWGIKKTMGKKTNIEWKIRNIWKLKEKD